MKRAEAKIGDVVYARGSIFYDDEDNDIHNSVYIRKDEVRLLVQITEFDIPSTMGIVLESPLPDFPPGMEIEFFLRNAILSDIPIAKIRTRGQTTLPNI